MPPSIVAHEAMMPNPEYYRKKSRQYRELAVTYPDDEVAREWIKVAQEYDRFALLMEQGRIQPESSIGFTSRPTAGVG